VVLAKVALVVEVLAKVALTVDAGRDRLERGFSSGSAALPNAVCCMWRITFALFEGVDTSFAGWLTTPSEVFLVGSWLTWEFLLRGCIMYSSSSLGVRWCGPNHTLSLTVESLGARCLHGAGI